MSRSQSRTPKRGKKASRGVKKSRAVAPRPSPVDQGRDDRSHARADARVGAAKIVVNPGGFGFAERTDGEGTIFLPPGSLRGAMDGDEAMVGWWPAERGMEGAVRSVIKRGRTRITGVLRTQRRRGWVEPDDPRIRGQAEVVSDTHGRQQWDGKVVVGRIVDYPDAWNEGFSVSIERCLGEPGSLVTEEAKILVEQGIDPMLPPDVLAAAKSVPQRVNKKDHEGRDDMRDQDFMTIDPPSARDFDDAVCVQMRGRGRAAVMRVHVAVADVSHYVRHGDAFDTEAAQRCFSTYLPDRAIPMLPEELSSHICSLVPKKDRCAMVVSFDLDAAGKVSEPRVAAALIHSRLRLSYDQVALELEGKKTLRPEVRTRITNLRAASDRLKKARRKRGMIGLDLPETKIVLDDDDPERVRDIVRARSSEGMTSAYNLIEELMIAANEVVGRLAVRNRLPVIYRVHDTPDEERVERLCAVAELLGVDADPDKLVTPKGFSNFVAKIGDHPRRGALHSVTLRSLAQAEYSTHNLGHFALSSQAYVHFTSPIRRYPDLVSHRVIKSWLSRTGGFAGASPAPRMPPVKAVRAAAEQASLRERSAVQAERDAKALFAAHYMRDRIGDRFEGTITGLSPNGVFVMLDDPPVDGMVKRQSVEKETRQSYQLDELGARMVASKSGRDLMLGDKIIVEVLDASLQRRQIDLAMVGMLST